MVKSPRIRHSKPVGEPLTIDLGGEDVARVDTKASAGGAGDSAGEKDVSQRSKPADASATAGASGTSASSKAPGALASASAQASADQSTADARQESSSFGREAGKEPSTPPRGAASSNDARAQKPAPQPTSRRSGSALAAGLLGGALALGGAGAAWYGGLIQPPAAPVQPAPPADTAAIDGLRAEVAALQAALDELRAAPPAETPAAPDLSDVNSRIEGLAALVEDLRAQLGGLTEGGAAPDDGAIASLREALDALETRVAALPAGGSADVDALRTEIASAAALARQASEAAAQAASASGSIAPRVERIETELAELSRQVAEVAERPGVALAIAASALKAAVDRGIPFTTELDTFARLAPDAPEVAALRPYAASGIETRADLDAGFEEAAAAMIRAARTDDTGDGLLAKLWASALSVVEVRPIGAVEGNDAPAIVARMEVALRRGDLAAAVAEYESLPEASRAAGATYVERMRTRLTADELVGKMLAAALRA